MNHVHPETQKMCPECGGFKLSFKNFQFYGGKHQEVYECHYCGPVVLNME